MMPNAVLIYEPLGGPSRKFRLLHISAEAPGIACSLSTYEVTQSPPYATLSYVWGDSSADHAISLNQSTFHVRENLWHALCRLKDLHAQPDIIGEEIQHFWIDAICVDQTNDLERGHQVNLMSEIFGRASLTVSWLGLQGDNSDLAMNTLAARLTGPAGLPSEHTPQEAWAAIDSLFGRPYFERMWIVQEVLLSRKLVLLCGSLSCWWDDVCWFHSHWLPWFYQDLFNINDAPKKLIASKASIRKNVDFWRLLELGVGKHCSDPRDRVYSLLGIFKQAQGASAPVQADYTIHPAVLYIRLSVLADSLKPVEPHLFDSLERSRLSVLLQALLEIPDQMKTTVEALRAVAKSPIKPSAASSNGSAAMITLPNPERMREESISSALAALRADNGAANHIEETSIIPKLSQLNVEAHPWDRALLFLIIHWAESRFKISLTPFYHISMQGLLTLDHMAQRPIDVIYGLIDSLDGNVRILLEQWQSAIRLDSRLRSVLTWTANDGISLPQSWLVYCMQLKDEKELDWPLFLEETAYLRRILRLEAHIGSSSDLQNCDILSALGALLSEATKLE